MRPVLIGDIIAAARVLIVVPRDDWDHTVAQLLGQARTADRYRRRFGRAHPAWGNGSVMAAASTWPRGRERFLSDATYLDALRAVIDGLRGEKLSFVSRRADLYSGDKGVHGGDADGRNAYQDGVD